MKRKATTISLRALELAHGRRALRISDDLVGA